MDELLEYLNRFTPETLVTVADFLTDGGAPLPIGQFRIAQRVIREVGAQDFGADAAAVLYVAADR